MKHHISYNPVVWPGALPHGAELHGITETGQPIVVAACPPCHEKAGQDE